MRMGGAEKEPKGLGKIIIVSLEERPYGRTRKLRRMMKNGSETSP
jgi:hypothetical protein